MRAKPRRRPHTYTLQEGYDIRAEGIFCGSSTYTGHCCICQVSLHASSKSILMAYTMIGLQNFHSVYATRLCHLVPSVLREMPSCITKPSMSTDSLLQHDSQQAASSIPSTAILASPDPCHTSERVSFTAGVPSSH